MKTLLTMKPSTIIFSSLLAASCSQTPYSPEAMEQTLDDMELKRSNPVETISYRNMKDWVYLDKYHIIFKAKRDESYLISFQDICYGLSDDAQLILESTTGTLSKFDDIVVNHRFTGAEICSIKDIIKLVNRETLVVEEQ